MFETYVKCLKLQKNAQTHSNIQIMRATQHLKAQTSYFSTRIFLGTIVVPMVSKIDIDSIEFLNKKFYANLQMKYYSYVWYPSGTQNLNKNYRIWAFQWRVDYLDNFPRATIARAHAPFVRCVYALLFSDAHASARSAKRAFQNQARVF